MSEEGQVVEITPEVVAEARQLGWVPQAEFRGDKSRWVDADQFVERGHQIMPILRQNNAQLKQQLDGTNAKLKEALDAIEELKTTSVEITKERVAAAKREVMAGIRKAREDGNVEVEDELTDRLGDLKAAEAAADKPAPARKETPADQVDPAFVAWQATPEGAFFGVDRRKTALAMAIAQDLKLDPQTSHLSGLAFYKKVAAEVEAMVNPKQEKEPDEQRSKVEGSRGGGSGGGGNGAAREKSYKDLPAEARAACDRQGQRFIGKPGYKTASDWQSYYAKQYFAGEE
jgi:hypothetical protein